MSDLTRPVKPLATTLTLLLLTATAGQAACYADYKAKQDDPLRLHYGVARISGACNANAAASELGPRLAAGGWQLLNVLATFDDSGLAEREASAGDYFLRY